MPYLSVVIPAYNNEKYMEVCIESVLQQSYHDFEIVICDDKSTDGTYEILKKIEAKYKQVKLIRNNKNLGVNLARHVGILNTSGKYITTLDHDDIYLTSDKLRNEINLIQYHKEKYQKDICAFSKTMIINANGNVTNSQAGDDSIIQGNILNNIITRKCMIPRDFIFLRTDYFKIGGFNQKLLLFEDWDLKIRLAYLREFYYTEDIGTGYRRIGEGFSYKFSDQEILMLMKIVFNGNIHLVKESENEELTSIFKELLKNRVDKISKKLKEKYKLSIEEKNLKNAIITLFEIFKLRNSGIVKL